jgi:hypothetical protein
LLPSRDVCQDEVDKALTKPRITMTGWHTTQFSLLMTDRKWTRTSVSLTLTQTLVQVDKKKVNVP